MARKRMISPTIWEDPTFNKLSIGARLLFVGMISNADDSGYLRANSDGLRRLIFGFDKRMESKVKGFVNELKKSFKNLHFYEVEGEEYAHFIKWHIYQKYPESRKQESIYPKCLICTASAMQVHNK